MSNIAILLFFIPVLSVFAQPNQSNLDLVRIVNSTETTIEEYPFIVSVQWYKYHICGGVIVSKDYVLTSARCIATFPASELEILAGSTDRNKYDPPAQVTKISQIKIHGDFNKTTWVNDIAILFLSTPLVLNGNNVKSIGFYEVQNPIPEQTYFMAIGWGVLVEGASFYPIKLHSKPMLTVEMAYCIERMESVGRFVDPECMFGTYAYDPVHHEVVSTGNCDGDWGGPLVTLITEENPVMELVGLASWGFTCTDAYPNIFTNLQAMRDFINDNTGGLWPADN